MKRGTEPGAERNKNSFNEDCLFFWRGEKEAVGARFGASMQFVAGNEDLSTSSVTFQLLEFRAVARSLWAPVSSPVTWVQAGPAPSTIVRIQA